MKQKDIDLIRKELRKVLGHNLTFRKLQGYIEQSKEPVATLMLVALMLGDSGVKKKAAWQKLRKRFYAFYRKEILAYFDFLPEPVVAGRIGVNDPDALYASMAALMNQGVFLKCSYNKLAENLLLIFSLKGTLPTISHKLKNSVDD